MHVVVDASVAARWYQPDQVEDAFRTAILDRTVSPAAPPLFFLELLNTAGRRWRWDLEGLHRLLAALDALRLTIEEPDIDLVATWVSRGLTSYDATYVALAEERGEVLATFDQEILRLAPDVARTPEMITHKE